MGFTIKDPFADLHKRADRIARGEAATNRLIAEGAVQVLE